MPGSVGVPTIGKVEDMLDERGLQEPVLDFTDTLPVEDLDIGDRYVVTSGEHSGQIAEWSGTAWTYTIPLPGYVVVSTRTGLLRIFTSE